MKILMTTFLLLLLSNTLVAKTICSKDECVVTKDMTFWGVDLYSLKYEIDKKNNKKITLIYKREISKSKNTAKGVEKFKANNENSKKYLPMLKRWNDKLIDTKIGTIYEVSVSDKGVMVTIDNNIIFETEDRVIGDMYMKIWTGEDSVDSDLSKEVGLAKKQIVFI